MPRADTDETGADELELYIENDGDLYRQHHQPIIKNLMAKRARGEYDARRAVDAFMSLVESGAKKYHREHGVPGRPWHEMFSVPTRRLVAQNLAKTFEAEAGLGNYDHLLPEKYQADRSAGRSGRQLEKEVEAYLKEPTRAQATADKHRLTHPPRPSRRSAR